MIISASRISTASGAAAVGRHVFTGPKNKSIALVQGSRCDLDSMVCDARAHGARYAIRHFKISPGQATTRAQALGVVTALAGEFGFDATRGVLVEHEKPRQGGKGFDRHWHFMAPEVDPVRGRVMSDKWMRARQEKVARVAEIELKHAPVRGKWSRAVETALRAEAKTDLADIVVPLAGSDPRAAYSTARHQVAERRGLSMPAMQAAVVDAWQRVDGAAGFKADLNEQGLLIRAGDKEGIWIVEAATAAGEPFLVGSVARLVHAKPCEVAVRLAGIDRMMQQTAAASGTAFLHRPTSGSPAPAAEPPTTETAASCAAPSTEENEEAGPVAAPVTPTPAKTGQAPQNGCRRLRSGEADSGVGRDPARWVRRDLEGNQVARRAPQRRTESHLVTAIAEPAPILAAMADRLRRRTERPVNVVPSPDRSALRATEPRIYLAPIRPTVDVAPQPEVDPELLRMLAIDAVTRALNRIEAHLTKMEPYPRLEDRLPSKIAAALAVPLIEAEKQAADKARRAGEALDALRGRTGFPGRLRPSVRREFRALHAALETAVRAAFRAEFTDSDRRDLNETAKAAALDRHRQRAQWLNEPGTKDAVRVVQEFKLVKAAVQNGDIEITRAVAAGALTEARKLAVGLHSGL